MYAAAPAPARHYGSAPAPAPGIPRSARAPLSTPGEALPEGLARPKTPPPTRRLPPLDTAKKKAKDVAEQTLAAAVASNNLETIEQALDSAAAAGLAPDHPAVAIVELVKSEILHHNTMRARAAQIIESGVNAQDLFAVSAGLDAAKLLGLEEGDASVCKALSARGELKSRKARAEEAEKNLAEALATNEAPVLEAALAKAEADGVDVDYSEVRVPRRASRKTLSM